MRTGDRSARGVAQDVPFFTAARLERRAGALTETDTAITLEKQFACQKTPAIYDQSTFALWIIIGSLTVQGDCSGAPKT